MKSRFFLLQGALRWKLDDNIQMHMKGLVMKDFFGRYGECGVSENCGGVMLGSCRGDFIAKLHP